MKPKKWFNNEMILWSIGILLPLIVLSILGLYIDTVTISSPWGFILLGLVLGGFIAFRIAVEVGMTDRRWVTFFIVLITFFNLLFIITTYPVGLDWYWAVLLIVIVSELFFLMDKTKPTKKEDKLWFTFCRKFESLTASIFILSTINSFRYLFTQEAFVTSAGVVLCLAFSVLGVIGSICVWVWLNSKRYRK